MVGRTKTGRVDDTLDLAVDRLGSLLETLDLPTNDLDTLILELSIEPRKKLGGCEGEDRESGAREVAFALGKLVDGDGLVVGREVVVPGLSDVRGVGVGL